jgi:hypothetical protein
MFGKSRKVETVVANWTTSSDGTLIAQNNNCRYFPCNDGTYELEFGANDMPIGLILETNSYGNYAIVKNIASDRFD